MVVVVVYCVVTYTPLLRYIPLAHRCRGRGGGGGVGGRASGAGTYVPRYLPPRQLADDSTGETVVVFWW